MARRETQEKRFLRDGGSFIPRGAGASLVMICLYSMDILIIYWKIPLWRWWTVISKILSERDDLGANPFSLNLKNLVIFSFDQIDIWLIQTNVPIHSVIDDFRPVGVMKAFFEVAVSDSFMWGEEMLEGDHYEIRSFWVVLEVETFQIAVVPADISHLR